MVQGIGRVNPLYFNGMGEWGLCGWDQKGYNDGLKGVLMMD
jgi:hypothetical protein